MNPSHLAAAAVLACGLAATPAHATLILQTGLVGGSGDVSNVVFNACGLGSSTGTTVQGCLQSDNDVRVNFTSDEALTINGGGQATIGAMDGAFNNFVITMADATLGFTKLQFNIDAAADGSATFRATDQFGTNFDFEFALSGSGNNSFTLTALDGQVATSFAMLSTNPLSGISDLMQVRVGASELRSEPPVPVPAPASLALFGAGLLGLGLVRRRRAPAA
jgi:hypothetical protein